MNSSFIYYNRQHGIKHYAALSAKTFFLYAFYLACLFSIPAMQYLSAEVSNRDIVRAIVGEAHVTLEVVSTEADVKRGLSGRRSLPQNHGMLFVFEDSAYHGIWMKEMLFAIDILWINEFNEIVYIERDVVPDSYPTVYRPHTPATTVLEVNAGFVDRYWLKTGDTIQIL